MNKDELLGILRTIQTDGDGERAHRKADDALLEYINDPEIQEAYNKIEKWYA